MAAAWGRTVADDDFRQYLQDIAASLAGEDDAEQRDVIVSNALEEVRGKEVAVATDAECSRHLEALVAQARADAVMAVLQRLGQQDTLPTVATNPFGSHVLETALRRLAADEMQPPGEGVLAAVETLVHTVKDDLVDFIADRHATFFARSLLALLSGSLSPTPADGGKKNGAAASAGGLEAKLQHVQRVTGVRVLGAVGKASSEEGGGAEKATEVYRQHVCALASVFLGPAVDDETLTSLQRSTAASAFLQALLTAVQDTSAHEAFYLRMLGVPVKEGEGAAAALKRLQASKVIAQMKNKAASHLVERLLLHAPASLYDALWVALKPHFAALCLNPVANFAMQSLIAAAPAARFVADMVPEVSEAFADVVLNHRSGVACVLLVAAACWRTGCEQLCTLVRKALPDGVVQGLAMLDQDTDLQSATEVDTKRPARLSVNGCVMLQALLAMPQSACSSVTDELLALEPAVLRFIAMDVSGSRVLEALIKGSAPKPLKRSLVHKLEPALAALATRGAPSRLVEAIFVSSDVEEKEVVARALAGDAAKLQGTKYGGPLVQVCQLELYQHNPGSWRKRLLDDAKVAAQYQKLFGDTPASKKGRDKKKRKKQHADGGGGGAAVPGAESSWQSRHEGAASSGSAKDVAAEVMDALGVGRGAAGRAQTLADRSAGAASHDAPHTDGAPSPRAKGKKRARHADSGSDDGGAGAAEPGGGSDGVHLTAEARERKSGKKHKCKSGPEVVPASEEATGSPGEARVLFRGKQGKKRSVESYVRGVKSKRKLGAQPKDEESKRSKKKKKGRKHQGKVREQKRRGRNSTD